MFTGLVSRFRRNVDEIAGLVAWQDDLRNTIHASVPTSAPLAVDSPTLAALRASAPTKLTWQVFDHCAAITRVYALFEKAVCELVELYLAILPRISPAYEKLDERIRHKHRTGVGQILTKWSDSSPLYSNLAEKDLVAGLADGLRAMPYTLLADAFLVDPDNFWASALGRLFCGLGFDNAFGWVRNSAEIAEFCRTNLSGSETADSFLDSFVRSRNEAAHGTVGTIASVKEIGDYCDYTALVLEALASLLRSQLIRAGVAGGCSLRVGVVLHSFSENIVGVESTAQWTIRLDDRLYGGKKQIDPITVVSIRIGTVDHSEIALSPTVQFGVKLDKKIAAGSYIYRWVA
jgi:hypothetical protein